MSDMEERLAKARAAVEQSCQLLLTPFPDVLDQSTRLLSQAIGELSAGRDSIQTQSTSSSTLLEFRILQSRIRLAGRLLETAASHYYGWDRVLRSMVAGYTSDGQAAAISHGGRLTVEA